MYFRITRKIQEQTTIRKSTTKVLGCKLFVYVRSIEPILKNLRRNWND